MNDHKVFTHKRLWDYLGVLGEIFWFISFLGDLRATSKIIFRCSLPKAMSISRSEFLRGKKAAETEVEKLPSVKVLESVS